MSSERSPITHSANYDTKNFWKHLNAEKKKEYLYIDTLYNRQFLEKSRALFLGGLSGLIFGVLLYRIKNRFLLSSLTSALSCSIFCHMRSSPIHNQYFRMWDHVKNDKEVLDKIASSSENMSNNEFQYFYQRYLRFFYPQLNTTTTDEKECKSCTQ